MPEGRHAEAVESFLRGVHEVDQIRRWRLRFSLSAGGRLFLDECAFGLDGACVFHVGTGYSAGELAFGGLFGVDYLDLLEGVQLAVVFGWGFMDWGSVG